MKEIKKLVLTQLRNDEYYQYMSDFDKLIVEYTVDVLGISSLYQAFKSGLNLIDQALKVERGSSQTQLIVAADEYRDKLDRGLELQVESYSYHWAPDVVDAARRIGRIIDQFGNLRNMGYNEESSAVGNKMQELLSETYAPDVAKLNLTEWVNKEQEANEAFKAVFNDRANETATRNSGNVRAARLITSPAYEALVTRINALVVVNGEETYSTFIDKVNYYVDYYKATIAAHKSRNSKVDASNSETKEEANI